MNEMMQAELLAALVEIAEMTDADNPDSYRADDREGCLDTVYAVARAAIEKAKQAGITGADAEID